MIVFITAFFLYSLFCNTILNGEFSRGAKSLNRNSIWMQQKGIMRDLIVYVYVFIQYKYILILMDKNLKHHTIVISYRYTFLYLSKKLKIVVCIQCYWYI
jgi:hypothetical protein